MAGSESTRSRGTPAWCAPSGRVEPACTESRATSQGLCAWWLFLGLPRAGCRRQRALRGGPPHASPVAKSSLFGCDQQLAYFAHCAIATAPLRHVVRDVLDGLRRIRDCTRQANKL